MKRVFMILAIGALALSIAPAVAAREPADLSIAVHAALIGNLRASTTVGTFTISGAIAASGVESGYGRFVGEGHLKTGDPNSLHSELDLTSPDGSITITLRGLVGQLPAAVASGAGTWLISEATGSYAGLHGQGSFTMTADFRSAIAHTGPPTVALALVGTVH